MKNLIRLCPVQIYPQAILPTSEILSPEPDMKGSRLFPNQRYHNDVLTVKVPVHHSAVKLIGCR
jgi:hypothetical protein